MSSLSGAHDEVDLPTPVRAAAASRQNGAIHNNGSPNGSPDGSAACDAAAENGQPTHGADEVTAQQQREAQLIRRARDGDRGAYGQIVLAYQDRLYNAVLRMVGDSDEAAEIAQEAFTRGLGSIETFRGEAGAYTWLFRIAMNLAISEQRKAQRHRVFSLDGSGRQGGARGGNGPHSGAGRPHAGEDQASSLVDRLAHERTPTPLESAETRERSAMVLAALGRVDADYRAVLVMRDIEGFDYEQMAQILDLPMGTLKSRIFRARLALRDQLKEYMD